MSNSYKVEVILMDGFANTYLCRLLRLVICQDISLEPANLAAEEFDALMRLAKRWTYTGAGTALPAADLSDHDLPGADGSGAAKNL